MAVGDQYVMMVGTVSMQLLCADSLDTRRMDILMQSRMLDLGLGSGFIILDSVNCSGNETSLLNCRAQEIGSHDCLATEDAGVICPCECHVIVIQ